MTLEKRGVQIAFCFMFRNKIICCRYQQQMFSWKAIKTMGVNILLSSYPYVVISCNIYFGYTIEASH